MRAIIGIFFEGVDVLFFFFNNDYPIVLVFGEEQ